MNGSVMTLKNPTKEDNGKLLIKFNNRDKVAFSEVYLILYKDLLVFTTNCYKSVNVNIDPADEVQDVFLNLWESDKQKFSDINNIKAYLLVAIRNRFINHLNHNKVIDKYKNKILSSDEYFVSEMVEVELFSLLNEVNKSLPDKCLVVFKEYLNGLNTKEIATKLNKSEFTVYKQRTTALNILRKKLSKDKMLLINLLIPILHL